MSPELLLAAAAGLLIAAGMLVWILHRILRKQCQTIARMTAEQSLPDVIRQLNELTDRIETQWADSREQSAAADQPPQADEAEPVRPPIESQTDEILRLSREGLDAVEIARRTGAFVGEAELVLNLNRAGAASRQ